MKPDFSSPDTLWVRGRHEVLQALKSGARMEAILVSGTARISAFDEILKLAQTKNIKVQTLQPDAFKAKVGADSQGIAARMGEFPYAGEDDIFEKTRNKPRAIIVALNHLEDPRNLGAIVRSSECAGVDGILIPKNRAAGMTEWAIRTSQGAAFEIPIARVTNLAGSLKKFQENGFWVVGLCEKGKTRYDRHSFAEKTVVVLGGEDAGLGNVVANACDDLVSIPMCGKISSLNVSVCAGIILFEILRQRDFSG